jgi:pentatricopeptide repeat protein
MCDSRTCIHTKSHTIAYRAYIYVLYCCDMSSAAIHACARAPRVEDSSSGAVTTAASAQAVQLLDDMAAAGIAADQIAHTAALAACVACSDTERAADVMTRMQEAGHVTDSVALRTQAAAAAGAGELSTAVAALEGMREQGVVPDAAIYKTILQTFAASE